MVDCTKLIRHTFRIYLLESQENKGKQSVPGGECGNEDLEHPLGWPGSCSHWKSSYRDEIIICSVYSNGTIWYDAVSYLPSYGDDPSVTAMLGDAVGTCVVLLSFLVPLEWHCPAISVGSRHSRVLRAPEIDKESWSIGALKATRWSGDPGALESLESLKLSVKFADVWTQRIEAKRSSLFYPHPSLCI